MKLNTPLSKQLALATNPRKQACFLNAFNALPVANEMFRKECFYVEGMVLSKLFIFEHAWIECNGEIIDSTLPDDISDTYLPISKFTFKEMMTRLFRNNKRLPLFKFNRKEREDFIHLKSQLKQQHPYKLSFDFDFYD